MIVKNRCAVCGYVPTGVFIDARHCAGCLKMSGRHFHRHCFNCRADWLEDKDGEFVDAPPWLVRCAAIAFFFVASVIITLAQSVELAQRLGWLP